METVRGREKVQEHLLIISGKLSQFHILYDGGQSLYGGDGEGEGKKKCGVNYPSSQKQQHEERREI